MSSSCRTSAWTNSASARSERSSLSNVWPASFLRPETMIRLPDLANEIAVARPIPVRAPVINATGEDIAISTTRLDFYQRQSW